jgi:hypothetical protein
LKVDRRLSVPALELPLQRFAIPIGTTISNGVPGLEREILKRPQQGPLHLRLNRQIVSFEQLSNDPSLVHYTWRLTDETGAVVFESCMGCTDPGARTLTRGGTYTITVGEDQKSSVGTYSLSIRSGP